MSEQLLKDLETYSAVGVALESSVNVPSDAQKILAIFMGENSQVSNEADYDNTTPSTLSRVNNKIKETVKNLIQWVMDRFQEFRNWAREYMLGREQAEKEVAAAKELLNAHPSFKSDKITLLPNVTGALAVEGRLDETFPDKFSNLRNVVGLMANIREDLFHLANTVIDVADKWVKSDEDHSSDEIAETKEVIHEYAKIAQPISKILSQPNPNKTLTGPNHAHRKTIFTKIGYEKVQDVTSLPLPGGYAVTSVLVKNFNGQGFMGLDDSYTNGVDTLVELLDNLSPNLQKVYTSGITFSGAPLNSNKCRQIIDEAEAILAIIRQQPDKDNDLNKIVADFKRLSTAIDQNAKSTFSLSALGKLMRASVKLIDSDRYKTYQYAIRTVRASLRYISASIDKKPQEEISPAMRLGAPA